MPPAPPLSAIAQLVETTIANNAIVVFSKTYCPYCARAKNLLTSRKLTFTAIELDTRGDGADIQQYLLERTKQSTVPNIFINKEHIGGSSDLAEYDAQGKLKANM